MTQQTFFDFTPTGHDTRSAAAASIEPYKATMLRNCYELFVARGELGLTDHELAEQLQLLQDTARARRHELMKLKIVANSGHERPSPRGRLSIVWTSTGKPLA
jgi:hypothetical protein